MCVLFLPFLRVLRIRDTMLAFDGRERDTMLAFDGKERYNVSL